MGISEIRHACADLDKNKDGEISFKEFETWIRSPSKDKGLTKVKAILAPSDCDGLEAAFYNFCGAGRADMDNNSFLKMCKDCNFIDKRLAEAAVDILFSSAKVKPSGGRSIDFSQFEIVLGLVAEKRCVTAQSVRAAVLEASTPLFPSAGQSHSRLGEKRNSNFEPIRRAGPSKRTSPRVANQKKTLQRIDATTVIDNTDLWKVFGTHSKAGRTLKRLYCTQTSFSPRVPPSGHQSASNGRQDDSSLTPLLPCLPPSHLPMPSPPLVRSVLKPQQK